MLINQKYPPPQTIITKMGSNFCLNMKIKFGIKRIKEKPINSDSLIAKVGMEEKA